MVSSGDPGEPEREATALAKQPSKSTSKSAKSAAARKPLSAGMRKKSVSSETQARKARSRFPIVGIGTSAGGLDALEHFLRHVPRSSGLAYVIVQHLDPTHKGMLPELLRRFTDMRVYEVHTRMQVRPDCVYVIPPKKDLSMLRGVLLPVDPDRSGGLRLPVDRFFRALAVQHGKFSVGVILSGMGSDGALGLRAIKENAGLTVVQDPAEAEFDGMPRSAIATKLADIVASARELPGLIIASCRRSGPPLAATPHVDAGILGDMDKIVGLLRARTGHDFSLYKKSSVLRRIDRRMTVHKLDKLGTYARYLQEHPKELDLLFKELLIGVTSFFRDPPAWEMIREQVIPGFLTSHPEGGTMRAWVPACSTGEEAYSLAMLFQEALDEIKPHGRCSLQIFATDLEPDAIEKARKGIFLPNIQADVGAKRLNRFFHEEGSSYRIGAEIREMVTFATQDVLLDPPFSKLDLICCRNLLIYLGAEPQKKLVALFYYSLNPGGVLFLGSAETVGAHAEMFAPMDPKTRLFRRRDTLGRRAVPIDLPAGRFPITLSVGEDVKDGKAAPNLASLVDHALLQRFCPAAVLVNETGDIVYISGRTGKYLEPATGRANWNIHAMAREGLRGELAAALHKAAQSKQSVLVQQVPVGTNGGTQTVDVSVQAIDEPVQLRGMLMVVFTDAAESAAWPASTAPARDHHSRKPSRAKNMAEAQRAIRHARDESRRLREEIQTTQEEFKSANEELQSTNEELQSTNEELTTSKEEMQSMNEELQTVNAELQSKVDELTWTSNDMKNLLDSTDIATIFLDTELRIRRFTTHATELFKLLPGDVNRPLSDIVMQLDYQQLQQDAHEVLRTLVYSEKQISASGGRWFKVRVMPYRTVDNRIDGVVITFTNITEHKVLEAQLRQGVGAS
jgi:two-component system CheB/CheR fusion protein